METQGMACAQIHLEIENEAIKEYKFFYFKYQCAMDDSIQDLGLYALL